MPLPLAALAGLPLLAKILAGTAATATAAGGIRALTGNALEMEDDGVGDGFEPSKTLLGNVLDFAGQTSQPILNLGAGRFGTAGMHILDLAAQTLDSTLPGDLIPRLTDKSDFLTPSEVLGVDEVLPGLAQLPIDIAGEVITSPLSLVSGGATSAAAKMDKAIAAQKALMGARSAADDLLHKSPVVGEEILASDDFAKVLGSALNRKGVQTGADKLVRQVIDESGGDLDVLRNLVSKDPTYSRYFSQGGINVAGKQVVPEGAIGSVLKDGADAALGLLSDDAAKAVRKGAAKAGDVVDRTLAAIRRSTGNLSLTPGTSALRQMSSGLRAKVVDAQVQEANKILGDLTPDQQSGFWDVFQNVIKDGDEWRVLQDDGMKVRPSFEKIDSQVSRLTQRAMQHPALRDMDPAELQQKVADIVNLNATQFRELTRMGVIKQPTMWHTQDGDVFTLEQLLPLYRDEVGEVSGEAAKVLRKIETLTKRMDNTALQLTESKRGGNSRRIRDLTKRSNQLDERADELDELTEELQATLQQDRKFQDFLVNHQMELKPIDTDQMIPPDYMQRIFRSADDQVRTSQLEGRPSFMAARSIKTPEDLAAFLNKGGDGLEIETNALSALTNRARQQGRSLERAAMLKGLLGDDAILADPKVRKAADAALDELAESHPDMAQAFRVGINGMPERGPVLSALNKFNRFWKPNILYGLAIPKVAAITKNRIGAVWQELSTRDLGSTSSLGRLPQDLYEIFTRGGVKGLGLQNIKESELQTVLKAMDDAVKGARGDFRNIPDGLKASLSNHERGSELAQFAQEAMDTGILEGFTDTEQLLRNWQALAKRKGGRKFQNVLDMPGRMFQDVEHRLRLGQFMDLRRQGVSADNAADLVQKTYLDYSMSGAGDRTMRDLIPFAAFLTRSVPQQAGALRRTPALAVGLSAAVGQNQDTVLPPWLMDQPTATLGRDDEGNAQVLGSLGLPVETLNLFPGSLNPSDLGESLRTGVIASSQPPLKAAYTELAGQDPFFLSPPRSDDRTPRLLTLLGAPERSEFGRAFRFAEDVGLAAPLNAVVSQTDRLLDPNSTALSKMLNLGTGARVFSINEDRALQQQLEAELRKRPDVRTYTAFYQQGEDEEVAQLLEVLNGTKAKLRAQRQAQP